MTTATAPERIDRPNSMITIPATAARAMRAAFRDHGAAAFEPSIRELIGRLAALIRKETS